MKWYFALSGSSYAKQPEFWHTQILASVQSATECSELAPHLIFDGAPCHLTEDLARRGVAIVHHRVSFFDDLVAHGVGKDGYVDIASGAFLRTEIPLVERSEDIVLYTDCDVLFRAPFLQPTLRPALFACASEADRDDPRFFNTGVMVMNLPRLREGLDAFRTFIKGNLDRLLAYDQTAYELFYGDRREFLPAEMNWRPYWGGNPNAQIVHFHGPKPAYARYLIDNRTDTGQPWMVDMLNNMVTGGIDGYCAFVPEWEAALGRALAQSPA